MKREEVKLLTIFALAMACQQSAYARQAHGVHTKEVKSVRRFVQDFYDWYAPKAEADTQGPASDLALKLKPSAFDPKLLRALRDDAAASGKADGEIVGLDFDPFLNSQDPEGRFVVGNIRRRGQIYHVSVYSKGKAPAVTAVVAELEKHEGHWRFSNFLYSGGQNLLSILNALKKDRTRRSAH